MPDSVPDYYHLERRDIQQMLPVELGNVLDVGCASGVLGSKLKERGAGHVSGIEFVPEIAKLAEENLDLVICGDIESIELPFPENSLDTIICADVLEHLRDPWLTLRRLSSLLKPDTGTIVVSVPNVAYYQVWLNMLVGNWNYVDAGILDRTHLRFFTLATAVQLMQQAGLSIERQVFTMNEFDNKFESPVVHDFLKKDVVKLLGRFEYDLNQEQKDSINTHLYLVWQFLFSARKITPR